MTGGATRVRCARALAIAALLLASGCFRGKGLAMFYSGAELPSDALSSIEDGRTTRREVLDRLGPPAVVVREPLGTVWVPRRNLGLFGAGMDIRDPVGGSDEIPAASFFARFGAAAAVADGDVVYFYRERAFNTLAFSVSAETHRVEQRLWILVDGRSGIVKAHLLERVGPPPAGSADREGGPASSSEGTGP